ncbi:MAG: hypothetical protein LBB91_03865 [Clostridiales bacterium]|jgi:hypothetical protein|nr:hypothetical protein [Clostridiales bacterium]
MEKIISGKRGKKVIALVMAVVMILTLSVPALSAYDRKTLRTPYGTLTGTVYVFNDAPNGVLFGIEGSVNSNSKFNTMYGSIEVFDYNTGARRGTKQHYYSYNDNFVSGNYWLSNSACPLPVTVYGCAEVRHTNSYAVYPTLYGTYGI